MSTKTLSVDHKKKVLQLYYDKIEGSENGKGFFHFQCKQCSNTKRRDNMGHSNLLSHIDDAHGSEYQAILSRALEEKAFDNGQRTMKDYVKKEVSKSAVTFHSWLELILMSDFPMSLVENELLLKLMQIERVTRKTLSEYMTKVHVEVRKAISESLPKTFGLIFDGNQASN